MSDELVKCPYDGGEVGMRRDADGWFVRCLGYCHEEQHARYATEAEARAAWNQRSPSPQTSEKNIESAAEEYAEAAWGPAGTEREKGPTRKLLAAILRKYFGTEGSI